MTSSSGAGKTLPPGLGKHIPVVYKGLDETPIIFANQFLLQEPQTGEFVLSFAQFAPPILLPGTDEEMKAQLDRIQFATITALGRYGLTETRLRELVKLLSDYLKNYDERSKPATGGGAR